MEPNTAVKLERLLIGEVSGVDDPANELPGFMVAKAFADSGRQKDGKERYPLDSEEEIRAAWGYINQADNKAKYSPADYKIVRDKIKAAMVKIGADVEKTVTPDREEAESFIAKLKGWLGVDETSTAPEGDIDMTSEELTAVLDERLAPLAEKVEAVSKSVEDLASEPAAPETAPPAPEASDEPETAPALTIEDVAKAIETALEPYNDIFEKVIDRLEATEKAVARGSRTSLVDEGSDPEPAVPAPAPLSDAITKALRNPSSVRVVEVAAS